MTGRGHPMLVYVESDPRLRRLAAATFKDEYTVEAVPTVDDVHCVVDPAVAIINLSESTDPGTTWDRLTRRWPAVPTVIVLSTEAAIERDREAFWALKPAAIVVNPDSAETMRRGVAAALS